MDDIDFTDSLSLCFFNIAGVDIDVDALIRSVSQSIFAVTLKLTA